MSSVAKFILRLHHQFLRDKTASNLASPSITGAW